MMQIIISPTITHLIRIILVIILAFAIFKILKKLTTHYWEKYKIDLTGYDLFIDVIKYCVILIALIYILNEIGINLQGILVSVGVVGIVIGLAAKDIFSNLMSGMLIIHDKDLKKGDVLKIKNVKGKIEKVTLRTTTLKTEDDFTIIIPNSVLNNTEYTVYGKLEINKIRLHINLPHINLKKFEEKLNEELYKYPEINKNKKSHITNVEITEYGYEIIFQTWITDYKKLDEYKIIIAQEAKRVINYFFQQM